MVTVKTLPRERFKLPAFRRGQREMIESILAGQNVLAVTEREANNGKSASKE